MQWSVWWGVPVPKWQEPLPEAMARYSAGRRAKVKPLYTGVHNNLRVAYLEPPIERIPDGTGLNEHWEWPYAARLAVNVYRAKKLDPANPRLLRLAKELKLDPYNLDGSKPHVEIHPARVLETWPTLAFTRTVTWTWRVSITTTRCGIDSSQYNNGCPIQDQYDHVDTYTTETDWSPDEPLNSYGGPNPGEDIGFFKKEFIDAVKAMRPVRISPCGGTANCSAGVTHTYDTGPVRVAGDEIGGEFPIFWEVLEMWGIYTPRERLKTKDGAEAIVMDLATGKLTDGKKKVSWLHQEYSYNLDYFTCWSAINGQPLKSWEMALPWPRKDPKAVRIRDNAVVGKQLIPPDPRSFVGWTNQQNPTIPDEESPPVHVPLPLYDAGSGAGGGIGKAPAGQEGFASPDGNWWASVGSIRPLKHPLTGDLAHLLCYQMGKVPRRPR